MANSNDIVGDSDSDIAGSGAVVQAASCRYAASHLVAGIHGSTRMLGSSDSSYCNLIEWNGSPGCSLPVARKERKKIREDERKRRSQEQKRKRGDEGRRESDVAVRVGGRSGFSGAEGDTEAWSSSYQQPRW